jgi:hypothetical protein
MMSQIQVLPNRRVPRPFARFSGGKQASWSRRSWLSCCSSFVAAGLCLLARLALAVEPLPQAAATEAAPISSQVVSLDGDGWLLATDPKNVGRDEQWWNAPRPDAKTTKVPWIIQEPFPGYHGVAWYWRDFSAAANPFPHGRTLLRFWAVDYTAEVWLNGVRAGSHEGGESPFVLDVTDAIRAGAPNRLAVRVLNPTHEPIDGIVLAQTPHRNKALPYSAGSAWNQGGIMDSVELLAVPPVYLEDVFVRPDWKTGRVRIHAGVRNTNQDAVPMQLELSIAPAQAGETLAVCSVPQTVPAGASQIDAELQVAQPRWWELNDPYLYRVTARLCAVDSAAFDEQSVRCGFRDFRVENGAFRLNGRRIYLRCSHTGNCCPIGLELPPDPDFLRRDLLNAKVMGFNAIRFIAGVAKRYQLDLCDEIGLMVYEEAYASWCLADSPQMGQRFDESILGMIRRDRNHASVTLWGLLNETPDGPVFRHAVGMLPRVRELDDSRLVMLNSGRWDVHSGRVAGIELWRNQDRTDPCVTFNATKQTIRALGITWSPGQLAVHPGRDGEYAAVRWTAPEEDKVDFSAVFASIAERATTDVHVLHNGRPLFEAGINVRDSGPTQEFHQQIAVRAGDTLDCVCGFGNGNYGADTTALAITIKTAAGKTHDAAADFSKQQNPNGVWSYGQLRPGPNADAASFALFPVGAVETSQGGVSNPGSATWEDILADKHPYQRVPHTAEIVQTLRTIDGSGLPLVISEYGIGSAVDLWRATRHYERFGATHAEDAQFYRDKLDRFLADWERWRMADAFGRPEDFFAHSNARMAGQRLLGLNAIRSNPHVIGYSLTGTVDQGMSGEGLWTTFRELKPGTADALFEGFAPLRFCLFVEPLHAYRGTAARFEAVLANEDALAPGEYPVRLQIFGPHAAGAGSVSDRKCVVERTLTITIPEQKDGAELPFVLPVFAEDLPLDFPAGRYRFLASFDRGAAATGGAAEFFVADPAELPKVAAEVVLWGEDPSLKKWLTERGIRHRDFTPTPPSEREVILAGVRPPAPGGAAAFRELAGRLARGSTAVFPVPEVFANGDQPVALVPLANQGALARMNSWLYHKDEWAKPHPIFEGLPTGMLDYALYRQLIPDVAWVGQDAPAEAVCGANDASLNYASGLMLSVHQLGAGRFILNTLRIREHLGTDPAADRLLVNLLRDAARDAQQPLADLPVDFDARLQAMGY